MMRSMRFFIYPVFKMAYSLFILTIKLYTLETIFNERVAQNACSLNTYRIFNFNYFKGMFYNLMNDLFENELKCIKI